MGTFKDRPDSIHDGGGVHGTSGVAGVAEDELLREGREGKREGGRGEFV